MYTALEAKLAADRAKTNVDNLQLNGVLATIENLSIGGHTRYQHFGVLSDDTIRGLKKLGYKVSMLEKDYKPYHVVDISW